MTAESEFVKQIIELLSPLGEVKGRAMYGGYRIFHDGRMFAIVSADSLLYFLTDDSNREGYTSAGSEQFPEMPYYEVPLDVLAKEKALLEWAAAALEAEEEEDEETPPLLTTDDL